MFVYRWEVVRELFSKHKDREGDPHDGLLVEGCSICAKKVMVLNTG